MTEKDQNWLVPFRLRNCPYFLKNGSQIELPTYSLNKRGNFWLIVLGQWHTFPVAFFRIKIRNSKSNFLLFFTLSPTDTFRQCDCISVNKGKSSHHLAVVIAEKSKVESSRFSFYGALWLVNFLMYTPRVTHTLYHFTENLDNFEART